MKVGVYGTGHGGTTPARVVRQLRAAGIDASAAGAKGRGAGGADCMVVLGGDRGVRGYFHAFPDSAVPVLGLGEAESSMHLAQLDVRELGEHADKLAAGRYTVDEMPRIAVRIDGRSAHPALNDVAVFAAQSAVLMEHSLRINGEDVWHDSGDGIIVSTPSGSSAYSMSAGGPVIFQGTRALGVISVNSLDVTRRPLIVPEDSMIEIGEISSKRHCEVVLDGMDRMPVARTVECTRSPQAANVIRLKGATPSVSAIARKVRLAGDLLSMSPSAKLLLKTLEYEGGAMTQRELALKTMLPSRTVRASLRHLLDAGHIKRRVSGRDARQKIYEMAHAG